VDRFAALETFISVYEAGSFSLAAKRLRVGQPAVSKAVAQLEKRLGVRLLLRSTRGLTPTESGQQFYERARRALLEAEEAEQAARGARSGLTGRLRVSAATTFARLLLVPRLDEFLKLHPQLSVDLLLHDHNIDLLEEGIDVALRIGSLPPESMTARRIAQSERIVVASAAYLKRAGRPKRPAELSKHRMVLFESTAGGAHWTFERQGVVAEVALDSRLRISAVEGVRAAVLAHMGIAIGSTWMFWPELADGTAKRLLPDWTLPPLELWAIYPAARQASAKARAFVAFVESVMAELK
jgi:DNA-binding transcriptional LysR family regulator